ncbi:hypothetical protein BD310DRAFT_551454 [Dichomitus squalens]|uniref:Uncharacterized protein n=1 Tax=Dichomitus squalens TaxID=114155 RepID=A0A4Q9PSJ3_9APHY|nr:hypothetical protein BD310DRAFT_551454 [Dichomitus squalens]
MVHTHACLGDAISPDLVTERKDNLLVMLSRIALGTTKCWYNVRNLRRNRLALEQCALRSIVFYSTSLRVMGKALPCKPSDVFQLGRLTRSASSANCTIDVESSTTERTPRHGKSLDDTVPFSSATCACSCTAPYTVPMPASRRTTSKVSAPALGAPFLSWLQCSRTRSIAPFYWTLYRVTPIARWSSSAHTAPGCTPNSSLLSRTLFGFRPWDPLETTQGRRCGLRSSRMLSGT